MRKIAKTIIEQRQVEYWDEVCEGIEKFMKNNDPTTAVSIVRRAKDRSKRVENMPIYDQSGKLLVNSKDTLKRRGEFFQAILNVVSSIKQDLLNQIHIPILAASEEHRQTTQASMEEIRKTVNQMKSRRLLVVMMSQSIF